MAYVQADVDEIKRSISTGALSTTTRDGQTLTFRSLADLMKTQAIMEAEVAGITAPNRSRPQVIAAAFGPPRGGYR